ncbi:MAG: UDP-N-acetylmuramate dehydrogenase [Saprospiraceae bacterium]|nr:UDP-N-acetylmuramate dehydrogenase [Saprospiraceae bacterium]
MISLKPYNSFGIEVQAHHVIHLHSLELLEHLSDIRQTKILGGGTNILFTKDIIDPIIKVEMNGLEVLVENEEDVLVRIGAGQNWHATVMWALDHNYGGIENLSLIPGTVGAAPVQNIGAYGVEIKDVLEWIEGFDLESSTFKKLNRAECLMGYRDSIFKNSLKNKFIITHVILRLSKKHQLNLEYGIIKEVLLQKNISYPNIRQISEAVIQIRRSKLPDPNEIGNAGSFFKNVNIPEDQHHELKSRFPQMPAYHLPDGTYKIASGWLIEYCGWKGKRIGNVACYEKQALVIVNCGDATGQEILYFSQQVIDSVFQIFGITLQPEVNIW